MSLSNYELFRVVGFHRLPVLRYALKAICVQSPAFNTASRVQQQRRRLTHTLPRLGSLPLLAAQAGLACTDEPRHCCLCNTNVDM